MGERRAYVAVATTDGYAVGATILAESLRAAGTRDADLVVLVTGDVSLLTRQLLANVYDHVFLTSDLYSHDDLALQLLGRPELATTFTKLHCWRLTQYAKCVYLDADTVVLQNCDELFERDELSAVPDTGWPDCFNSGVFVFRPSLDTYSRLVNLAATTGSFDGGDQGLLNSYFGGRWRTELSKRLPFIYNVVSSLSYTYAPAYKHYASTVKIVHFLGPDKPWATQWHSQSGEPDSGQHLPVLHRWIQLFRSKVFPKLPQIARDAASTTPYVSVLHLLHQINSRREESSKSTGGDELVQTYFPSHPASNAQTPWFHATTSNRAPSPIEHHHQHHTTESPPEHRQPESSGQTTEWTRPPDWQGDHGSSHQHHHHHEQPTQSVAEPVDPHWEALLWHAVQTPWEPPPPPSPDLYVAPEEEPWRHSAEQSHSEKTFGWFSSDTGSRPEDATTVEPAPSVQHDEPVPDAGDLTEEGDNDDASLAAVSLPETAEQSIQRMKSWEEGQIDYLGRDRFDNIWKRIETMLHDDVHGSDDDDDENAGEGDEVESECVEPSVTDPSETLASIASNQMLDNSADTSAQLPEQSNVVEGATADDGAETASEGGFSAYQENDFSGMYAWQEGNADYCGRDQSDNIMRHLDRIISGANKRPT